MNNSLKIGLDIHGVIDTFPQKFKQLSQALAKDGAEIHIITGMKCTMASKVLPEPIAI